MYIKGIRKVEVVVLVIYDCQCHIEPILCNMFSIEYADTVCLLQMQNNV